MSDWENCGSGMADAFSVLDTPRMYNLFITLKVGDRIVEFRSEQQYDYRNDVSGLNDLKLRMLKENPTILSISFTKAMR